ncbi:MAG TPA: hypothetical protein VEK79_00830 [Thermoanaerobaculia bacterium]|nr:hypothetical protein [Thermoanaerobaculia bacterium]
MKTIAIVLIAFAFIGCVSSHTQSRFHAARGACSVSPEMLGQWTSSRPSQLGSAKMTLTLNCDCSYTMRVAAAIARITEDGEFRAEGDRLVMSRSSGSETTWPYRIENGKLHLTEHENETHEYQLVKKVQCAASQ